VTLAIPIPKTKAGKLRFFETALVGMIAGLARALASGKRFLAVRVQPRGGELDKISSLIEAGKLRPVIETIFPLDQIAEAHRVSEKGHVRGKLVIKVSN
jgi:NADPH:quinone reductase-like Zn-dependent oxidoreductase